MRLTKRKADQQNEEGEHLQQPAVSTIAKSSIPGFILRTPAVGRTDGGVAGGQSGRPWRSCLGLRHETRRQPATEMRKVQASRQDDAGSAVARVAPLGGSSHAAPLP